MRINRDIIKIIISAVLFVLSLFFRENIILLILSFVIVSYDIFIDAFKKLLKG